MTLMEQIEQMSEAEMQQLLDTNFGEEMEKEASAELAKADLADALYAYGAYMADLEIESQEELSKEAAAEFDAAHAEITAAVEQGLMESGLLDTEDTAALHQEAQAAAGLIFEGYSDQIEKVAASKKADLLGKAGKMFKKHVAKPISGGAKHLHSAAKKHPGKAAAIAAGTAGALGAGAYAYKKHHEKKASEVSTSELAEIISEDQYVNEVIAEGIDKLAAKASGKGAKSMVAGAMKHIKAIPGHVAKAGKAAGKYVRENGKPLAAGALGGAAVGAGAMHMAKKNKED